MTSGNRTPSRSAGTRWGPDDERGAPNLLTAERVLRALRIVERGQVHTLGRPLSARTPLPSHRPPLSHFMLRDGGDHRPPGSRLEFADDVVMLATHTGTHVDSLAHVWYGGELYNGFPAHSVGSRGAGRCGIEKLGPLVARGVLVDLAGAGDALPDGEPIEPERLAECLSSQGTELEPGDVVLLRTGWWAQRADAPDQDYRSEPGPGLDAARWLAQREVAVVGADNFAFEVLPSRHERAFPVHELLLRDHGVPIIEGLDLDSLAAARAYEFLFIALALPIVGATASPVNPIAVT